MTGCSNPRSVIAWIGSPLAKASERETNGPLTKGMSSEVCPLRLSWACLARSGSVIGNAEKMYRRNSSHTLWANWTGLMGMGTLRHQWRQENFQSMFNKAAIPFVAPMHQEHQSRDLLIF